MTEVVEVPQKEVVVEEKKPFFSPKAEKPAEPKVVAPDSKEAGLQQIREAINLIKSHSATAIGGSMLHQAVDLLENGYGIIERA
jgi:hypothetical protein